MKRSQMFGDPLAIMIKINLLVVVIETGRLVEIVVIETGRLVEIVTIEIVIETGRLVEIVTIEVKSIAIETDLQVETVGMDIHHHQAVIIIVQLEMTRAIAIVQIIKEKDWMISKTILDHHVKNYKQKPNLSLKPENKKIKNTLQLIANQI